MKPKRTIHFIKSDKPLDKKAVAEKLARIITGGDYEGYLAKVRAESLSNKA